MVFDLSILKNGYGNSASFNPGNTRRASAAARPDSIFPSSSNRLIVPTRATEKQPVEQAQFLSQTCDVASVAKSMIKLIDAKDSYTGKHSKAVQKYAGFFAKTLGLSDNESEVIKLGSAFHDIGKIGVPEEILNTEGPLSDEQFERLKQHPVIGSRILEDMPAFKGGVSQIVKHHHEHWDGSGYPNNLSGENIPFGARIVAVADAYHAMTSNRPYRKGMSRAEAIQRLENGAGTQWDPELIKEFVKINPMI